MEKLMVTSHTEHQAEDSVLRALGSHGGLGAEERQGQLWVQKDHGAHGRGQEGMIRKPGEVGMRGQA